MAKYAMNKLNIFAKRKLFLRLSNEQIELFNRKL